MYICNCNGLTERQVRGAIDRGARTPREVYAACGCTAKCGRCACEMRDLVRESSGALEPAHVESNLDQAAAALAG